MRLITGHESNDRDSAIQIVADDRDPINGNASHAYSISIKRSDHIMVVPPVVFQRGPIKVDGPNGITHEVLLSILIDRLAGFQVGPHACDENLRALRLLIEARAALFERTQQRVERGVEGTHEK